MRRRLIIISIAVLVLVIPSIVIVWLVNRSPRLQNAVLKVANVNTSTNTNSIASNTNTTVSDPQAVDRAAVIYAARNFAERYGSESNQNDFANIVQAEAFCTDAYTAQLNATMAQQRLTLKTTPFTSTVTKALSISVTALTGSTANVTVGTQRQETIDRTERVYYQDLVVQVVKDGNSWKISGATWQSST